MYRALERALEEANEALRSRDEEIEVLKRERDFAMADLNSRRSTRSPDNHVDVFEGASFDDRHSIITDLTERSVLMTEALHPPTPPIQRRLLEPTSIHANANANANMAPLPNATVHAIPDMPTKVPAPPPTLPTDVVANAAATAFAHYHRDQNQSFRPKLRRQRANIVRAIPKKTDIPVSETDHRITDDRNEEDVGNIGGEGLDNCSWKPVNVDNGNHDRPRSIKTVSYITCCRCKLQTPTNETTIAVKKSIFNDHDRELGQSEVVMCIGMGTGRVSVTLQNPYPFLWITRKLVLVLYIH